jgi:FKBP-type peptidyl-prolyl cis-trans isomerase FklB
MNTKAFVLTISASLFVAAPVLRAEVATSTNAITREKTSYAIGMYYGSGLKRQGIEVNDINYEELVRALKASLTGETLTLSEPEMRDTLNKFQQELNGRQQEKRRLAGEKNKVEGPKFLEENKSKSGIVVLPSGLQYKVITDGFGDSPKAEDIVNVNYRGTLIDGTEFDSSYKRGQPAKFRVTGVIAGWTEALQKMKPGSKWQLFVPSNLAYGENGNQNIAPNATLIFEVELVSVEAPPPAAPPAAPLTSDIIKVPSLEEMKKGAKIETIKAEDVEKLQKQQQTNTARPK